MPIILIKKPEYINYDSSIPNINQLNKLEQKHRIFLYWNYDELYFVNNYYLYMSMGRYIEYGDIVKEFKAIMRAKMRQQFKKEINELILEHHIQLIYKTKAETLIFDSGILVINLYHFLTFAIEDYILMQHQFLSVVNDRQKKDVLNLMSKIASSVFSELIKIGYLEYND